MPHDPHDSPTATAASSPLRDRPWVLATWPEGSVHRELPRDGSLVVGRGEDCDFVVPHRSVSRRHARIALGPPMTIEDLGSANGTKLRGRRLAPRAPASLEEGVAIEIGDVALLVRGAPPAEPAAAPRAEPEAPLARELAHVERERIVDALARCGGNQTRAAALLGISRRTLVNRMNEYALPRPLKGSR